MSKLYDLSVKTGSYTNNAGEVKSSYENIGIVMQGDKGQYMLLKRTFNPAGVTNPDNKDMVMVSMFEPKERSTGSSQSTNDLDQDIPF